MLYEYFKEQFLKRIESFGQQKLVYEKEKMRLISQRVINRCKKDKMDPVCEYYKKNEGEFLDELRDYQTNKSLQILLNNVVKEIRSVKLNKSSLNNVIEKLSGYKNEI